VDVLQDLTFSIAALNMNGEALASLLDGMSNVEHRLAFGTDEKLQTASLVGVFVKARQSLEMKA
jgi:replication factor C subunit 3/5